MYPELHERRSSKRLFTELEGWIESEAGREPIACIVWDLSETGVQLIIPPPADIPLEFELKIPNEGAIARLRLIWAAGHHYGARFLD